MIRQSESITKLAAAFVNAQAKLTNAPKETKGQVGSAVRFYTDLPTLTDHVRTTLAMNGLAYLQFPCNTLAGHIGLCTRLIHESGEWLEDEYSMPAGQGAQGAGSALTYARRYALMAVLGIAADDDDGAAASQGQTRPRKAAAATTSPAPRTTAPAPNGSQLATEKQVTKLNIGMADNNIRDRDARLAYIATIVGRPVESSKDLTTKEARDVIDALDARKAGRS